MEKNSSGSNTPISLPKGGGAIKGIGETFQPNLFSGTGNFSVPIYASPGRDGFGPQLSLQYSTGNGNGPFGVGWQLSLPRVTRKTEKGLPTYTDKDVYVLSGAEDLVPWLEQDPTNPDNWQPFIEERGDFRVELHRPRTEEGFSRIEKWSHHDGDVHWRAVSKENITSVFGRTEVARIVNPRDPVQVYEWLLEETFDAKGNHIFYEYVQEDPSLELPGLHEHNRTYTQVYIRRILYGNTPDNLEPGLRAGPVREAIDHTDTLATRERHYVFEVLFDYGDLSWPPAIGQPISSDPGHTIPSHWQPIREDPFSSFRAGFEIRTLRLCRRALMLHHFKEGDVDGAPLVKSTDFSYAVDADTQLSFLSSATLSGYRKDSDNPDRYLQRSVPPVVFEYSAFRPEEQRYQSVQADGGDLPPNALNFPGIALVDVFGNGLPDILQTTDSGFHFWQNLGEGQLSRRRPQPGDRPAVFSIQDNVSFGDMGGDGLVDLLVDAPPLSGFYESTPEGRWTSFKRFDVAPTFDLSDPNTRLVDLTGDGLSDVLITRDEHFLWYRCKGEEGYEEPRVVPRQRDLERFPDVYFDDPAGRVRLADMSGDGLSDIVLIHDGRIDYWPNLGFGRFGHRLTMANSPRLGHDFDPRRLFLVDLDGSGCTDLVYVAFDRVHFWLSQSGNRWSERRTIHGTPRVSDVTAVQFADFYGTGTATLVWSYDFDRQPGGNYKILDFTGGRKPNLLVGMDNNMGATTRVQYAPSTKFYLEDKTKGTPWFTSLPFPVQVLEKTEVIDHISRTKLTTTYKYHHGYYDGHEREFRGFGRVDQFETESFDDFSGSSLHQQEVTFDNNRKGFHVPPVETRTWYHTGVYFDPDRYVDHQELTERYRSEYYQGDTAAFQLDEQVLEQSDGAEGIGSRPREQFRALRGAVLRTEVYGRDESLEADHPYMATENRYRTKELQPRNGNSHGVYLSTQKESISYHYERNHADPRIGHSLTLGIDDFGNVTDSVTIGYPRRVVPDDLPEQGETTIVYSRNDFINKYSPPTETAAGHYYVGVPCQTRTYEVTGIHWEVGQQQIDEQHFEEIRDRSIDVDTSSFKPHEWQRDPADSEVFRRIIEWTRAYFRTDADPDHIDPIGNLDHRLPLGEIESLALPCEAYQAALTDSILQQVYGERTSNVDLANEGGYHPHPSLALAEGEAGIDEYWWIPSGRQGFDRSMFFRVSHAQDPFGNIATTESDAYSLLIETVRDALPAPQTNEISARNDYRVLQPIEVTDPNGNRSQVAIDALGMVVGTAVMAKPGEDLGDSLDGFEADLTSEQTDTFQNAADPKLLAEGLLADASSRVVYDLDRFWRSRQEHPDKPSLWQPVYAATVARETHVSDLAANEQSKLQVSFSYSDGFGREIQMKMQAEPGPLNEGDVIINPRWVGSGWIIFNNKGKPVRQFEPFFSDTHRFEFGVEFGVSPVLFYDPTERVVATLHPNHTYEKVVFDPWQQTSWDVNDTVLGDPRTDADIERYTANYFANLPADPPWQTWHAQRQSGEPDAAQEQIAADKAAAHASTPTTIFFDSLGRPILTAAHNRVAATNHDLDGTEEIFHTRVLLDIEGNQREVRDAIEQDNDAQGRIVMRYTYDMLGSVIHQASIEAGERWMLADVTGQPIRAWDSRGHIFRTEYDPLRRPRRSFVTGTDPDNPDQGLLTERLVYGEQHHEAEQRNLRGGLYMQLDQAGAVTTEINDFKGNPFSTTRRIATEYKRVIDWRGVDAALPTDAAALLDADALAVAFAPLLEADIYQSSGTYDALDRPVAMTTPHTSAMQPSIIRPGYNEANLLEHVEANLNGETDAAGKLVFTPFVTNIDYNAKGQRQRIEHGNGVSTVYDYDPLTFRLTRMQTHRSAEALQDLAYTYDPAGNITHIRDDAQQTIYFRNKRVEPNADYTYDAIYRLIEATGREHLGQVGGAPIPHSHDDAPRVGLLHRGDGDAMSTYIERYVYDAVGNFEEMRHLGTDPMHPGWVRSYTYDEPSLIESAKQSNRLSSTTLGNDTPPPTTDRYIHDAHGNMIRMPHLGGTHPEANMHWDYRDQLHATGLGGGGKAFYTYDASGERVRKVWEKSENLVEERFYLGGFEIYRRRRGVERLERETLHIMDDQQRIALVETRTQDTEGTDTAPQQTVRYQLSNHLGSANLELDDQAQIISYEEYTPYGSTSYQAVRSLTEVKRKRYRYTGMERDEESGFSYHSARYYLPWLGRWASCDPLGLVDGLNLFRYSRNNPILHTDPSGTGPHDDDEFNPRWLPDKPPPDNLSNPLPIDFGNGLSGAVSVGDVGPKTPKQEPDKGNGEGSAWSWFKRNIGSRAIGAAKVAAGGAGFFAGALLTKTGAGAVVGIPLMLLSADVAGSGVGQAYHGTPQATAFGQAAGPKAQKIQEDIVDAAGLVSPFAIYANYKLKIPLEHLTKAQKQAAQTILREEAAASKGARSTGASKGTEFGVVGNRFEAHIADAVGETGVEAILGTDGMLTMSIRTSTKTPSGGQMFNEAIWMFGSKVKGIRGVWRNDDLYGDNFRAFEAALKKYPNLSKEEVARSHTFTGIMAGKNGFNNVKVLNYIPKVEALVNFTR